jgi:uncharacterized protein YggE
MKRLLLAVPALLAVAALAGTIGPPDFAQADDPGPTTDTVVVTGMGSVKAVPDEAELSFGVETRGSTAKAALAANGDAMRKVIAALRDAGARDLATQYVSVWPISEDGGTISGYSASNSVSATTGVERAGDLIDAATAAGANNVSGPVMSQSDADRVYRQALAAAITDARLRAEALAKAADRSLGAITKISEGGEPAVPYYERGAMAADAATPIVPGKQETNATVSVTFELR